MIIIGAHRTAKHNRSSVAIQTFRQGIAKIGTSAIKPVAAFGQKIADLARRGTFLMDDDEGFWGHRKDLFRQGLEFTPCLAYFWGFLPACITVSSIDCPYEELDLLRCSSKSWRVDALKGQAMGLRQARARIEVLTNGQGFYDITKDCRSFVKREKTGLGLLTVFLHHTSASLIIQENADPTVQDDLMAFFKRLAPEDGHSYKHGYEGPDDMPAHIRTALTAVQLAIPVSDGDLELGRWQGVYLVEHRYRPHQRGITLHLLGE